MASRARGVPLVASLLLVATTGLAHAWGACRAPPDLADLGGEVLGAARQDETTTVEQVDAWNGFSPDDRLVTAWYFHAFDENCDGVITNDAEYATFVRRSLPCPVPGSSIPLGPNRPLVEFAPDLNCARSGTQGGIVVGAERVQVAAQVAILFAESMGSRGANPESVQP